MSERRKNAGSDRLVEIIEENRRRREKRQFLEELGRRISIARQGRVAYEKADLSGALNNYRRFLTLTAKAHDVEVEDLKPSLFNEKDRTAEALLISAITLDLAKILDQLDTPTARVERSTCLRLFVMFTLGMPFRGFVAEGLRKFIMSSDLIKNREEFQAAYNTVKVGKFCFVATCAFGNEDAVEVQALRRFRDEVLLNTFWGRAFARTYYELGPWLARRIQNRPVARGLVRHAIRLLLRILPN